METLGDKIRKGRKDKGLTQAELAKIIGVTREAITQWENNKVQNIRPENLFSLEQVIEISARALYNALPFSSAADATASHVPLMTWHNLSQLAVGAIERAHYTSERMLPCPVLHNSNTFALKIEGADMDPKFRVGEIIFCDPARLPVNGDFVIVRTLSTAFPVLRQLMIEPSGHRYLRALNPSWPQPIMLLSDSAEILATVIFKGEEL